VTPDLDDLLRRPAVLSAVRELGLTSLGVEDVLLQLRRFGAVRVDVTADPALPFTCVLDVAGEEPERRSGATVLQAALACWAVALEGVSGYADRGVAELERFLRGS
jgi:hypothetical protein